MRQSPTLGVEFRGNEGWRKHSGESAIQTSILQDAQKNDVCSGAQVSRSPLAADDQAQCKSADYLRSGAREESNTVTSQMTLAEFIECKFLPQRVSRMRYSGRTHYMAMLKHVLVPEEVRRVFHVDSEKSKAKLKAIPGWPYIGDLSLQDARPEHILGLTAAALERGYSPRTISHIRNVIRAVFAHARKERCFLGENPASSVILSKAQPQVARALSFAQAREVMGAMEYPEREMAFFTICTDMGVSEICGLQWKCINTTSQAVPMEGEDLPPRTIAVRKQWYRSLLANVVTGRTRNLPMSDAMVQIVSAIKDRSKFTNPEDFVLTSRLGTPVNQTNVVTRRLRPLARQLKLPSLSWQLFRRTRKALVAEFGPQFQDMLALLLTPAVPKVPETHQAWHCRTRRSASHPTGF